MNFADVIKLQILQRTLGNNGNGFSSPHTEQTVFESVQQLALQCAVFSFIACIDQGVKLMPDILAALKHRYEKRVTQSVMPMLTVKKKLSETAILLDARHDVSTVYLTRDHRDRDKHGRAAETIRMNEFVDSILDEVSKLRNVPSAILTDTVQFLVNYKETPIQMTNEIFFQLQDVTWKETSSPEMVHIALYSNSLNTAQIIEYIRDTARRYRANITSALGNNLYFFNQIPQKRQPCYDPRGEPTSSVSQGEQRRRDEEQRRREVELAPKTLQFDKTPFYSSKTFDNICGKEAREVRSRVEFFLKNRDWYNSKGIPYTLGIMLSGVPGSGKTSILRAIANRTGRHIINVNFANIKTSEQMRALFTSEEISLQTPNGPVNVNIPINRRLYVLEEIDALGGIVLDREENEQQHTIPGELNLADILTAFDGTVETPERMVVITSNYPDRLDRALIRPGRVDVSINFGNASPDTVREMIELYMSRKVGEECTGIPECLTCAEVSHVLLAAPPSATDKQIVAALTEMANNKLEKEHLRALRIKSRNDEIAKGIENSETGNGIDTSGKRSNQILEGTDKSLNFIMGGLVADEQCMTPPSERIKPYSVAELESAW